MITFVTFSEEMIMKILVTGAAGFIGFHLVKRLLGEGHDVTGADNISSYYDTRLKYGRLAETGISREAADSGSLMESQTYPNYRFCKISLEDKKPVMSIFANGHFDMVCHLAAQAGVRYSLEFPQAYIDSNITGFLNILEACRYHPVKHLVYASSSSVYGNSTEMPLSTGQRTDHPVSLYAATKKSNELMAHTYSHLFQIPATGLRFFTVYGPWGRPDMAYFSFTRNILEGMPVRLFNNGDLYRDFTYIDDIVEGISRVMMKPPTETSPPATVYNIGHSDPVSLQRFVEAIETATGKQAVKEHLPMQPGDVYKTYADVSALEKEFGYHPATPIETGIQRFVEWYLGYSGRNR